MEYQELKYHVNKKLKEAEYFLKQMKLLEKNGNVEEFQYMLSAFLSSSRSVLQYLCKYRKDWYENNIDRVNLKTFFKHKRDVNIHEKTIDTVNQGSSSIYCSIDVVTADDNNENIDFLEFDNEIRDVVQQDYKFYFSDTDESKTVVELSTKYLEQIKNILNNLNE